MKSAAVRLIGIVVFSGVILFLFYNNLLFGLSVEQLDDYLIVFTAVSLFVTLWLLMTGGKR